MNRRELLESLGIASASTLLWACGARAPEVKTAAPEVSGEVRTWLRDAVAKLASQFPTVHALAVTRRRTTAALDTLGAGVGRARRDGIVLTVRDRDGLWREQVTSDLTEKGIAAAVIALVGPAAKRASLELGKPPPAPPPAQQITDDELRHRVEAMARGDRALTSRVVYAAALIDIEDSHVWSIAPSHDREQRLVRFRKRVIRAAWNGTRPVVADAERAWIGGIDDQTLDANAVSQATQVALELMTPGNFDERERAVILDPSVTASLVDAGARGLLTSAAARRPEVMRRRAIGASLASPKLGLVDDPTARGAYGGFAFDDEGEPAAPVTLIAAGSIVGALLDRASGGRGRGRRPGHVGAVEAAPSHLRVAPGDAAYASLRDDAMVLEGGTGAVIDPSTDRVVIGASRAREMRGGVPTGRVFADVELVGELAALLGAVDGVAKETAVTAYRDEVAGEPRWRSVEAPYLRTKGLIRARRLGDKRRA